MDVGKVGRGKGNYNNKFCNYCKQPGHDYESCWKRQQDQKGKGRRMVVSTTKREERLQRKRLQRKSKKARWGRETTKEATKEKTSKESKEAKFIRLTTEMTKEKKTSRMTSTTMMAGKKIPGTTIPGQKKVGHLTTGVRAKISKQVGSTIHPNKLHHRLMKELQDAMKMSRRRAWRQYNYQGLSWPRC